MTSHKQIRSSSTLRLDRDPNKSRSASPELFRQWIVLGRGGLRLYYGGSRNQLFISGGQCSWTFIIRWRHRAYLTVVQLFCKRSQIKFSLQHFRKWKLFSFNQDADRTIRTNGPQPFRWKEPNTDLRLC